MNFKANDFHNQILKFKSAFYLKLFLCALKANGGEGVGIWKPSLSLHKLGFQMGVGTLKNSILEEELKQIGGGRTRGKNLSFNLWKFRGRGKPEEK